MPTNPTPITQTWTSPWKGESGGVGVVEVIEDGGTEDAIDEIDGDGEIEIGIIGGVVGTICKLLNEENIF